MSDTTTHKVESKAAIYYYDIGDYLSREEKLARIRDFGSVKNIPWRRITPNEKHDWINQRDGVFDSLILIGDKDDKTNEKTWFTANYSNGVKTQRDSWCYNSSLENLKTNMSNATDFYNQQRKLYADGLIKNFDMSPAKISWTTNVMNAAQKNVEISDDKKGFFTEFLYRPFFKQYGLYSRFWNERTYQMFKLFPTPEHKNLVICVSGVGVTKDFSCIITDTLPDLELIGKSQCFPLYWYEENKSAVPSLFGESVIEPVETTSGTVISTGSMTASNKYIRHDGITDWILAEVRRRYGNARAVTKEHIFYYVYGILHSPQYRERFAADLKKSLPRIPIADTLDDFMAFSQAGKRLAHLHLNYERAPACKKVQVEAIKPVTYRIPQPKATPNYGELVAAEPVVEPIETTIDEYAYYAVEKMTFAKTRNEQGKPVADKSTIFYNHYITLKNIPAAAYDYVVNGKSAVEWLMERYAVTTDKDSLIKNDPNDWSREHDKPRYVLDLLLSVITVSVQTAEIVAGLPRVELG